MIYLKQNSWALSLVFICFSLSLIAQRRSGELVGVPKSSIMPYQIKGSKLVFIEGGSFNMGKGGDEDKVRRVTVSAFYIDATEVSNQEYRAYLNWTRIHLPKKLAERLPDTTVWSNFIQDAELSKKLSQDYFRNTAFDYYPVVGVSWAQAQDFLAWRSDQLNLEVLRKAGLWTKEDDEKYPIFETEKYYKGAYNFSREETLNHEVFIFPSYRLPIEAEWELAALAFIGNQTVEDGKVKAKDQEFQYNPSPKKGKYWDKRMNKLWKKARKHQKKNPLPAYYAEAKVPLPKSIFEGDLNDYGLFNMNDNVAEWVLDVHRKILTADEHKAKLEYDLAKANVLQVPDTSSLNTTLLNPYVKGKTEAGNKIENNIRVVKGASVQEKQGTYLPGMRRAQDIKQQPNYPLGFRGAMTRVSRTSVAY
jgi:formylglycine-generating enzyme required for sulfatase activity